MRQQQELRERMRKERKNEAAAGAAGQTRSEAVAGDERVRERMRQERERVWQLGER